LGCEEIFHRIVPIVPPAQERPRVDIQPQAVVKTSHRTLAATTMIKVNTAAIKILSDIRREKYNPPPESNNGAPKKSRISQGDGIPSDGVSDATSPNPKTTIDTNAAEKIATASTDSFIVLAV
jgi:hypothetical protein